jgi:uncharacterized protein (DUF2336 family)
MINIASAELITELDDAIRDGSPERRAQMLRQVSHLFLANASRIDERQTAVFGDVLLRLIARTEPSEHVLLSATLCGLTSAPREVIGLLARHEQAAVAVPVLLKSEALPESDLIEIADLGGQQHLLAISGRKTLGEPLTDALLKRGEVTVYRALARNVGARFSDQSCLKLATAAERDGDIADALAARPYLPIKVLHDLVSGATKAAPARLPEKAPPRTCEKIREVVESTPAGGNAEAPEPIDYSESKSRVLALSHAGKLGDQAVNRFAVHGPPASLVAALALLTDTAVETIEPLLKEGDCYGLIVACRAARLDWQTTSTVIDGRRHAGRLTQEEIEQAKTLFETLSLSVAQRTIRWGSVRDLAKPGLTDDTSPAARAG